MSYRDLNPFRAELAEAEVAAENRDYPWMTGFNALVDHHYFTNGEITLNQAVDEVDVFACGRCNADPHGVSARRQFASGCQYSYDVIAKKNFGGERYATHEFTQPFMAGVGAAASVLEFATEEAHV